MLNINRLVLFLIVHLVGSTALFGADYSITSFGAVPDGNTLNTKAIQDALDKAFEDKGGRVIVPSGKFLTGSLVIKSGVELHLQKGARIIGSADIKDYYAISRNNWKALLMSDNAYNIAITGSGSIDGQGTLLALFVDSLFYVGQLDSSLYSLRERRPGPHARPQIIQFVECKKIRVKGIAIRNSASWVQTYDMCEDVVIDKIRVESVAYWNNDGIDIIDCKNVRITNSFV